MVLLVNAKAGPSDIHGTGLIAEETIAAGTPVWRYNATIDLALTGEQVASLPAPAREQVLFYAYHCSDSGMYVLPGDDSRHLNHSDTPNTEERHEPGLDGSTVAARDIGAGEEITVNYYNYDLDAAKKLKRDV